VSQKRVHTPPLTSAANPMGCCKVESIVSVDDRGQMVLPKEVRDRANIRPGEKLAVIACESGGEVCCIALVKAEALTGMAKAFLGPTMKRMFAE